MNKYFHVLILYILTSIQLLALSEVDSLKNVLERTEGTEKIDILNDLSVAYRNINTAQALFYAKEAINLSRVENDQQRLANSLINEGIVSRSIGRFEKAMENFHQAQTIANEMGNKRLLADAIHKIGVTYLLGREFNEALKYAVEEIKIWEKTSDKAGLGNALNFIGLIYININEYEKGEKALLESQEIFESLNNKKLLYKPLVNLGDLYLKLFNPLKAILYIKKSKSISESTNNKYGVAIAHLKMSEAYQLYKKYDESIASAKLGLKMAEELQSIPLIRNAYRLMSSIYEEMDDYKRAYQYNKLYIATEDSMVSEITKRKIAEIENKFDVERKEKEIETLTKESEYSKFKLASIGALLSLTMILLSVIFRRYQEKSKPDKKKDASIAKALQALEKQKNYFEEEKSALLEQKNIINQSLIYANNIQNELQGTPPTFMNIFKSNFYINLPNNIVSGDLCRFHYKEDNILIFLADCSSEGVPGGFNKLVINSLISDVLNENPSFSPADILSVINEKIIKGIYPDKKGKAIVDIKIGLALLSINVNSKRAVFSGAKVPLYLNTSGNLQLISADDMVMGEGGVSQTKTFTNKNLSLKQGDKIIIATDGYQLQENLAGEVFGEEKFNKIITQIGDKGLGIQEESLYLNLRKWQGDNKQTDDITIFGLEI